MLPEDVPLPGILDDIERAAGRDVALLVKDVLGGTRVSFPMGKHLELHPENYLKNALVRCVGIETALRIVKEITPIGGTFDIPSGHGTAVAQRRQWVLDYSDKFSTREIARRLGITQRCVERIRQKLRNEGLLK